MEPISIRVRDYRTSALQARRIVLRVFESGGINHDIRAGQKHACFPFFRVDGNCALPAELPLFLPRSNGTSCCSVRGWNVKEPIWAMAVGRVHHSMLRLPRNDICPTMANDRRGFSWRSRILLNGCQYIERANENKRPVVMIPVL